MFKNIFKILLFTALTVITPNHILNGADSFSMFAHDAETLEDGIRIATGHASSKGYYIHTDGGRFLKRNFYKGVELYISNNDFDFNGPNQRRDRKLLTNEVDRLAKIYGWDKKPFVDTSTAKYNAAMQASFAIAAAVDKELANSIKKREWKTIDRLARGAMIDGGLFGDMDAIVAVDDNEEKMKTYATKKGYSLTKIEERTPQNNLSNINVALVHGKKDQSDKTLNAFTDIFAEARGAMPASYVAEEKEEEDKPFFDVFHSSDEEAASDDVVPPADSGAAGHGGAGRAPSVASDAGEDDPELAAAIAASMKDISGNASGSDTDDEEDSLPAPLFSNKGDYNYYNETKLYNNTAQYDPNPEDDQLDAEGNLNEAGKEALKDNLLSRLLESEDIMRNEIVELLLHEMFGHSREELASTNKGLKQELLLIQLSTDIDDYSNMAKTYKRKKAERSEEDNKAFREMVSTVLERNKTIDKKDFVEILLHQMFDVPKETIAGMSLEEKQNELRFTHLIGIDDWR